MRPVTVADVPVVEPQGLSTHRSPESGSRGDGMPLASALLAPRQTKVPIGRRRSLGELAREVAGVLDAARRRLAGPAVQAEMSGQAEAAPDAVRQAPRVGRPGPESEAAVQTVSVLAAIHGPPRPRVST